MNNPWGTLPSNQPYVLESDKQTIEQFHKHLCNYRGKQASLEDRWENECIRLELFPEPFIGRRDAPILLLNLNPGYSVDDQKYHIEPEFESVTRLNLRHESLACPFYPLDPRFSGSPLAVWWAKALTPWYFLFENDLQAVSQIAQVVLAVEYFPYHSRRFGMRATRFRVPSQDYTFHLVREALKRDAIIVVLRGQQLWRKAIPELETYGLVYHSMGTQNVSLKPGKHLGACYDESAWGRVKKVLQH